MSRVWERLYPYLVALAGGAAFWRSGIAFPAHHDILGASVTLGAVFVGFLATSEAIVVSLQGPIAEQFRQTKFYNLLLHYTQEAIWVSIAYCVVSLTGYFLPQQQSPHWYAAAWVTLTIASLATFYRVSLSLVRVIGASTERPSDCDRD